MICVEEGEKVCTVSVLLWSKYGFWKPNIKTLGVINKMTPKVHYVCVQYVPVSVVLDL